MTPNPKLLIPFLFVLATPAKSETVRQLDAHNHGEARLSIVMNNNQVGLSLHSPSANLIGFEHEPRNEEQHAQVKQVKELLSNHANLFGIAAEAECQPIESTVHWTLDEDTDHTEHEEHEEHEEHDTASHSEFEVEFLLDCEKVEEIGSIEVQLFELFPALKTLHVEALFTNSQFVDTLSIENSIITIPK